VPQRVARRVESKQTTEGLRAWLKPEIDKWGALIRAAGTYAD
jgi:hypothetical protein